MKKQIRFQFKGTTYTVDVERDGNELTLESSGKTYQVTLLPEEGAAKKPAAAKAEKSRPTPTAAVAKSAPAAAPVASAAPVTPAPLQPAAAASANILTAPLTGVVKEIKATEGRKVEAGEVVIVMEAMKMDIDISAQVSGTVQEVYVRQGDSVSANQQLIKIE